MDGMIKTLIIGCGPHATHFYLPTLLEMRKADASLSVAGILDILPQKNFILQELTDRNLPVKSYFIAPFSGDSLSEEAENLLDHLVDSQQVNAVIISTDPLHHFCYAQWAIKRRLPILLDKPVTTSENAVENIEQAKKIEKDYDDLLSRYEMIPAIQRPPFILCAHRRYHPGILFVRRVIDEVSSRSSCPVTNIRSMHADGQWRMPHEILIQKHHSYNEGYGKVSHSGFHFIDCVCEFWKNGLAASGKKADGIDVFSSFVRANGLLKQLSHNDYEKLFGNSYADFCPESDEELKHRYSQCGEIDAEINLSMHEGGEVFSLASIGLLHNSYSQRSWLEPSRDLYKGNGRIKHEEHIVNIGPFLTIQVHSYQSKDQHQHCGPEDDNPGGNNHFEVNIFRNSKIIGGKPFEALSLKEISGAENLSHASLFITQIKKRCIVEWLEAIRTEHVCEQKFLSAFTDHRMSVKLMSAIYQSYCMQRMMKNPVIRVPWSEK